MRGYVKRRQQGFETCRKCSPVWQQFGVAANGYANLDWASEVFFNPGTAGDPQSSSKKVNLGSVGSAPAVVVCHSEVGQHRAKDAAYDAPSTRLPQAFVSLS
jgi:hypothetical protein